MSDAHPADTMQFPSIVIERDGWRLFSYDPLFDRQVWVTHEKDSHGKIIKSHFKVMYNVEKLIAQNKEQISIARKDWKGDYLHHVASVPLDIYYDKLDEAKGQSDQKYVRRWLNDGDNRAWRVKEGTL